jgi:hypothetical protein
MSFVGSPNRPSKAGARRQRRQLFAVADAERGDDPSETAYRA